MASTLDRTRFRDTNHQFASKVFYCKRFRSKNFCIEKSSLKHWAAVVGSYKIRNISSIQIHQASMNEKVEASQI